MKMKSLFGWNSENMFIFLVLSCFKEITAGFINLSRQHVRNKSQEGLDGSTNRLRRASGYFNMLISKQTRKNIVSNDQIAAMFRRNARSITHKNQFLHHLHKQFKSIRKNENRLLKHNFKYQEHKRYNKSRQSKKSSHSIRNSYHTRGHRRNVKILLRNLFSKNTRRGKGSESRDVVDKGRLPKKFKPQTLVKRKRKKLRERSNFHSKSDLSKLTRSRMENKYKIKDNRQLSNTQAPLIPQTEQSLPQHSKPKRRQNHKHKRRSHRKHKNVAIEARKRDHKGKNNALETKEHQQKNNHRNSKFGQYNHKRGLEKAHTGIFSKSTAQHHTRIANHERSKIPKQQLEKHIAAKRRLSKRERKHLATPCHHNCLGLHLRINARSSGKKRRSKHTGTLNVERLERITSHPPKLFEAHNHKTHSSYLHTKHKRRSRHKSLRYSSFTKKERINRKERFKRKKCRPSTNLCKNRLTKYAAIRTKSGISKVGDKHRQNEKNEDYQIGLRLKVRRMNKQRPRKFLVNKIRDERQNNYKKQGKNRIAANKKPSVENDSTPGVLCEDSKKKIREMIIKMNKAVRRSIILAKIIGGKFGIDDKTIEAILSKEEKNISRNVLDFKKEAVNI